MTTAASESGPAGQTPPPRPASLRWPLDQGGWNPVPTASPGENLIETADVRGTVELEYSVPPGCQAGERPVEFAWLIHEGMDWGAAARDKIGRDRTRDD